MTDNEINELIATKFFEQPKPPYSRSSHIDPVGNGVWICQTEHHGKGSLCNWQPLPFVSDPAACALVLDEIERRGWYWEWFCDSGDYVCEVNLMTDGYISSDWAYRATTDNRYRAVCLAVLAACGVAV